MAHRIVGIVLAALLAVAGQAQAPGGGPDRDKAQDPGKVQDPGAIEGPDLEGLDDTMADLEGLEAELDALAQGGVPEVAAGAVGLRGFKGFVESKLRSFFRDRGGAQNDEQWITRAEVEFDLDLGGSWVAFFRPRFAIDALDEEYRRIEPFEAWAELREEGFDLRIGQFVENWGIADTFNPVDVLNRRDLGSDFLDLERLGEFGVRYRMFFTGGDTIGEPTLSIYALPVWRPAEFPPDASRWSFSQGGFVLDEGREVDPSGFDRVFLGLRGQSTLTTDLANADLQIVLARGPERFPVLEPRAAGAATALVPVYYGTWTVGGGLRAVPNADWWSALTLKAEVVYKKPFRTESGQPAVVPEDHLQWAVGFDRLFPSVLADNDQLTLTVEHVGETGADDIPSLYRPFDDDLVLRLFWEAGDFARTSVELRVLKDLRSTEVVYQGILERQLRWAHENLKLIVDVQVFERDSDEPSLFSIYPTNNSNAAVALRFDF